MRKKILLISSIFIFIASCFLSGYVLNDAADAASKAKTLAELRQELKDWKRELKNTENKKEATKNEISNAKNSVSNKQNEIESNRQKIAEAIKESEKLTVEIANGKKDLANLIKSYQIANGDNIYLEYIFASSSYEELIYRYAVIEQIMEYQEKKISEWKDKIEYNNQLKIDLDKRETKLNEQINNLANEIDDLGNKLEDYFDISLSIEDEIKSTEELIRYYTKLGCKENEDLEKCVSVKGDTGFRRPLTKGVVTSNYGYRTHPVSGKPQSFHYGIDMAQPAGTKMYSAANGMVGKVIRNSSCGGNQVYIYHVIKGKKYTTAYLHMKTINVKVGDTVTNNTVIGTVGGQKGGVDTCTTGAHLHFSVGTGWYGKDYLTNSKWKANNLNPRNVMNIPNKGTYWYSR